MKDNIKTPARNKDGQEKEQVNSNTKDEKRQRNWTCVGYPESIAPDYLDYLKAEHIPCVISPLHDADTNGDGTEKKPHWHFCFHFQTMKSYGQMKAICDRLKSTIPQTIHDMRSMVRYCLHLDNPEKAQYSENDLIILNGFNIEGYLGLSNAELNKQKMDLIDIIDEHGFIRYRDFITTVKNEYPQYFGTASSNTFFFREYINGNYQEKQEIERNGIV